VISNSTPQVLQTPEEYDSYSLFRRCKKTKVHSMYQLSVSTTRGYILLKYPEVQDPKSLDPDIESTYGSRAIKAKGHWKTKTQSPPSSRASATAGFLLHTRREPHRRSQPVRADTSILLVNSSLLRAVVIIKNRAKGSFRRFVSVSLSFARHHIMSS
jgi:hypothetical protein